MSDLVEFGPAQVFTRQRLASLVLVLSGALALSRGLEMDAMRHALDGAWCGYARFGKHVPVLLGHCAICWAGGAVMILGGWLGIMQLPQRETAL